MPTLTFIGYLILLAAVFLFRLSYLGWFGPYLVLAFITVPAAVLCISLPSMRRIKLETELPPSCSKGAEANLVLRFRCGGFLPTGKVSVRLKIENRFTGEIQKKSLCYSCVSDNCYTIPIPTESCGLLVCSVESFKCSDLFDMFSIKKPVPISAKCAVIPAAREPEKRVDLESVSLAEPCLKPKYGGGFSEEHELREYRPGDTVNSIHWKLSSKTDNVIIREAMVCENDRIYLVLLSPGKDGRGLESLYWQSLKLCRAETAHYIISDDMYFITNETDCVSALRSILSGPASPPCKFDASLARCVLFITDGEVRLK